MTIRTVAPKNYIPPTAKDVRAMGKQVGVEKFSTSLVQDLCNIQAGGSFTANSKMLQDIAKEISKLTKEIYQASDGDYKFRGKWLHDSNGDYVRDRHKAEQVVIKKQTEYHNRVQDFIRTLDFDNVPGYSPLEKSMGLLRLLAKQPGGSPSDDEDDEVGDSLPVFTQNDDDEPQKDPKESANRINGVLENIANMDEHEKILCNVAEGNSPLSLAEEMLDGRDIMLKIKRELDKICFLQTTKNCILKPDANGAEIRYRPIKNISEFPRLHPTEFMYPQSYKNYRLLNSVSQVRERCSKINRKMLLYIICDCSSSMEGERFLKAGGIVMNRLKAVLKGEADCWLSFFHNRLGEEFRASSENIAEVKKLMSHIKASNFNAGSTAIANCTKNAIGRIEKKRQQDPKLIKPQLLVITDGDDDTTSLKLVDLGGITLHSIIVGGHNQHLINISRQSGGVTITRI